MAKRKFRIANSRLRIVNRCIMCNKVIPMGRAICSICNAKRIRALRRR